MDPTGLIGEFLRGSIEESDAFWENRHQENLAALEQQALNNWIDSEAAVSEALRSERRTLERLAREAESSWFRGDEAAQHRRRIDEIDFLFRDYRGMFARLDTAIGPPCGKYSHIQSEPYEFGRGPRDWRDAVSDFFAGWGDEISFGFTKWLRDRAGLGNVDTDSAAYGWGTAAGTAHGLLMARAHLGRNALYQMGTKPSASRGLGRLLWDDRNWKGTGGVSDTWSRAFGGGKPGTAEAGVELHHWLLSQKLGRKYEWLQPIVNAGFNYLPISEGWNNAMGRSKVRTLGFAALVLGLYGAAVS